MDETLTLFTMGSAFVVGCILVIVARVHHARSAARSVAAIAARLPTNSAPTPGNRFLAPRHAAWRVIRPVAPATLDDILALNPVQFEGLIGALMANLGHNEVTRTGGPGDLNADITCRDALGRAVIVQCKRYKPGQPVGAPVVQTFIGMIAVHHGAHQGYLVTTSRFTRPAVTLARRHGIVLIDGDDLPRLLHETNTPVNRRSLTA